MSYTLLEGSNLDLLPTLPDCSVDAIVTDPPYELGFMGKSWDASGIAYSVDLWRECLRVLKHGGHLLAFGGSRTYHRLACAVEDAGFEIRDQIMWVYGSGFPKSLDISKAIDKAAGAEREVLTETINDIFGERIENLQRTTEIGTGKGNTAIMGDGNRDVTAPATDQAKQWSGWGTALKPAHEPIVVARKPLDGTVANNVLKHGVGGFNIDGCRIEYGDEQPSAWFDEKERKNVGFKLTAGSSSVVTSTPKNGRFPANFIHDGSEEVLAQFPDSKSTSGNKQPNNTNNEIYSGTWNAQPDRVTGFDDSGSAARFFYCAKASKAERNAGLEHAIARATHRYGAGIGEGHDPNAPVLDKNFHPTVKPIALMRYLIRLVTPPNGTVLDPFAGSGTTLVAAIQEGMQPIGIELTEDYWQIIHARCEHATTEPIQQTLT